jgi:hypothetical protein
VSDDVREPRYEVLSPLGRWAGAPVRRPGSPAADGGRPRRIGFLWDRVFRGDEMFRIAEEELRAGDPSMSFVSHTAFGDIHGPDEAETMAALPARLRAERVDAVIVGVGA